MLQGLTQVTVLNPVVAVTENKTLNFLDGGTFQNCTNTTGITITVNDAVNNLPIGFEVLINQDTVNSVTINATTPTVLRRQGSTATTGHVLAGQYSLVSIKKVANNEYRIYGAITW
jgi:hypothetical protein